MGPFGVLGPKVGLKWAFRFLDRCQAFKAFTYVPTCHDVVPVQHRPRFMAGDHHRHLSGTRQLGVQLVGHTLATPTPKHALLLGLGRCRGF